MTDAKTQGVVKTAYGYDLVWANTAQYCGKICIYEKTGSKSSLFFHTQREKSIFVNAGEFVLRYIDTETAKMQEIKLSEGDVWQVSVYVPHQLECKSTSGSITEVGNPDNFDDVCLLSSED